MFRKILIANRGEIAVRIIRTCREMGIETVAIYSQADRDALHVQLADEAICVGPAASSKSYLNVTNIVSAAMLTGVDAVHPGYGYLSERASFAEICESHGLVFIGPPPSVIELMGDKAAARRRMREVGLPVLPGSDGPVKNLAEALEVAEKIGYPVMIKAVAGGGGKGMRLIKNAEDMRRLFPLAQAEAAAAFGDGSLYVEKYLEAPRHIEIQILADRYGNVVHLGERECSLQRRHQKILEEAPSSVLTPAERERLGALAVQGAAAVGYVGAGTMEFLMDNRRQFYFCEMNTRIQVEHPVTEMITGIDLVREQIRIAAGERLGYTQEDIKFNGHAIECRINAEDPDADFRPSPGLIQFYHAPGGYGVRVDSHIFSGYEVPPHYDSLLAKLICWGKDRQEAIARTRRALAELTVEGIRTNIGLHRRILQEKRFINGELSTRLLEDILRSPQLVTAPAGQAGQEGMALVRGEVLADGVAAAGTVAAAQDASVGAGEASGENRDEAGGPRTVPGEVQAAAPLATASEEARTETVSVRLAEA
ncbi:MAG: acetyl-CoA carboxylase biotin carboxylase subunit [Limnochordales bacterium]|nr:acetyl-CoA carboxylase biotin carboxylase subunit [Limnochordales bacterium]